MRKIEWVFLLLGAGLFVALLDRVGWSAILQQLRQVGWFFLLVLVVSAGRYLFRTFAWQRAFPRTRSGLSLGKMFQVRLAGETLNYLSIAGPLLGEPAKATLLRSRLPLAIGLGGTMIEAGAYAITSGWVIVMGLVLALLRVTPGVQWREVGWMLAGVLTLVLLGSIWLLQRQVHFISAGVSWLQRLPLGGWVEKHRAQLEGVETQLLEFSQLHRRDFRLIFLHDTLAQVFALLEIYLILGAFGVWVGWRELFIFEALAKIIKAVFFFVPGRVGTDEGGHAALFHLLGFGLALGVGLALVRRLRALLWSAVGLVFLYRYATRKQAHV